ncbi:MAG TPA: LLM class flavin-dependent oxidoreductase [Solirubrobacteraceae bacterium]|jgi:alkanesulfonate monooxygenase SsuD/methylene tetrahydromethanopterin reductase-like flavin-dependent oxidoreductase (luciferase family)|nr:LLM class flavin-dependent oxidoreductase [Solirubrobacteraceae bacterium]
MNKLRFGYALSPFGAAEDAVDLAVRAELAGFDAVTIADLPRGLSPLLTLTAVAQHTSTITLSPFVINTGLWNPATIGRDLATLHRISGGRLDVALGSGIPQPLVAELVPPTRDLRFERLVETVRAVKATFEDAGITPGYGDTVPRMLVAGASERVLRLAAEETGGFIIAAVPPVPKVSLPPGHMVLPERDATAAYLDRLRGYAGDGADDFEIGVGAPVTLTHDLEAKAKELAEIHSYLEPRQVLASPKLLVGDIDSLAAQIVERRDSLGITYTVMRGPTPEELAPVLAAARAQR